MPLIPLDRITSVDVNVEREVEKLAHYHGPAKMRDSAMHDVYFAFLDLKLLKFFKLVYGKFGNRETENFRDLRSYDIFEADPGNGRLFIVVDISSEALHAFMDDGSVAFKLREWLVESCVRVVDTSLEDWKPLEKWDRFFYGKGTVLPSGVRVIPFYNDNFAPGVPALILALVKQ